MKLEVMSTTETPSNMESKSSNSSSLPSELQDHHTTTSDDDKKKKSKNTAPSSPTYPPVNIDMGHVTGDYPLCSIHRLDTSLMLHWDEERTGLQIYIAESVPSFVDGDVVVDEDKNDDTEEITEEEDEKKDEENYLYQSPPMRKKRSEAPLKSYFLLDGSPHSTLYEMFKSSSRASFSNLKALKRILSRFKRVRPGTELKEKTSIFLLLRSKESLQRVSLHPTRLFVSAKVHETRLLIPQQNLNFGRVRSDTSRVRSFTLINSSSQSLPYKITTSGTFFSTFLDIPVLSDVLPPHGSRDVRFNFHPFSNAFRDFSERILVENLHDSNVKHYINIKAKLIPTERFQHMLPRTGILDFGRCVSNQLSRSMSFAVRNTSSKRIQFKIRAPEEFATFSEVKFHFSTKLQSVRFALFF